MNNNTNFSAKNRFRSFRFALNGLFYFFKTQHNGWIQGTIGLTSILLGLVLNINLIEWTLLMIVIGMVITAEILNTAIELLTDIVSPEFDEKAGRVKDIAAGAVLFSSLISVAAGIMIFVPKIAVLCQGLILIGLWILI